MYFSDISKLKNITITTRKQQKLKHIVVLILRMLAILFIVLALAGPELKNDAKQSSDSGTITFFVDNSYSMMAEGSAGRLFENARQEALQIIEQSADNSNFIILSNNNDGNLLRLLGKEAATSELEKLEISSETKKLSDVIVMRNRILLNNNITDCETYLFSDFQVNSSDILSFPADSTNNYFFIPIQQLQNKNIYIDSCYIVSSELMTGSNVELKVWINNDSDTDYEKVPLKLSINDQQKAVAGIDIVAGSTKQVTLNFKPTESGWNTGAIEIEDFPITFDDKMHFAFNVVPHIKILIIEENRLPKNGNKDYLRKFYSSDKIFNVSTMNYRAIEFGQLSNYDLIIINELPDFSSGSIIQFKQYISNGGNLLFIPPSSEYSDEISIFLSGMNAGNLVGIDTLSTRITRLKLSNRLFSESIIKVPQNAELPTISRHYSYKFPTNSGVETLVSLLSGDDFLSKKEIGSGQLYILSVGLGNQYGDFTSQLLFSPIMHGIASKRGSEQNLYYILGEDDNIKISISNLELSETPFSLISNQSNQPVIPMQQIQNEELNLFLDNIKLQKGYYKLMLLDSVISLLAFNYNRDESEMEFYDIQQLDELCNKSKLKNASVLNVIDPNYKEVINALQKESDFWKLFIIFALSVILLEILVLRYWK